MVRSPSNLPYMTPSDPQPPQPTSITTEFLPGGWTLVEKIADTNAGAVLRVRRGPTEVARARILSTARLPAEEFTRRLAQVEASFRGISDPSIVRLAGGGIAHGTPFLIYPEPAADTKPVADFILRHNLEDRLALFFTICRAVRQAHSNLLPHGDLGNPTLVGVAPDGTPVLSDFGAAYLSGDEPIASTRPDIVALGSVVLPAVFAGRSLPAELRDIAAKAEQSGYESVEQLALDVERYAKGFPVLARPQTSLYRARKFLFRHKALMLAATGATVVGLLFLWYSIVSIRERYRLEAALNDLRGTAGLMAIQMPQHIADLPQSLDLRRKMIAQGVTYLDEHLPELNPEDRVQRKTFALGQYETANAMVALGDFDQALTRYRSAQDLFWQDGASLLPDPQVATAMGDLLVRKTNLLLLTRKSAEAAQAAEQCLTMAPSIRGGNDSITRIRLTCRALRVRAILDQAGSVSATDLAALDQAELELGNDKNATGVRMDARYAMADAYFRQGNHNAALDQARIGLDLVAGINKGIGASIQKARLMFVAGLAETALGGDNLEHAANRFAECIDILREIMRRDPRDIETRELLARALIESAAFVNPEEPLLARGPLLEADTLAKGLLNEATVDRPTPHMLRTRALGKLGELTSDCTIRKQAVAEFEKVTVKLPGEEAVGTGIRSAAAKACP
ncbi:hypothetical protein F183_A08910 [Bryobacterales bacterium F-183]|nr:hypothetical protein F183_A08910 [Bryobacterales bacterium F-183]